MNPGYFEQISDSNCKQRLVIAQVAARARRLQAGASTPRVRQYLDKVIAHCEQLALPVDGGALVRVG
jgi:hypothetical protein